MLRPEATSKYVPCPQCRLLDFYVQHDETTSQTSIVCAYCSHSLLELQWAPAQPPDPPIII